MTTHLPPNPWVQATPVFAFLLVMSQAPGDTVLKFKCFFSIDAAGRRA